MRTRVILVLLAAVFAAQAQTSRPKPNSNPPPPRSEDQGESSSKDTMIDLSPPKGDATSHPNGGIADDVLELHPYNPMKAMKDVEVGDYYLKQKNYFAAISRYREALDYKPNDAVATFKLAQALERSGDKDGARDNYEAYLKILPSGPDAPEAKKALQRLPAAAEPTTKAEQQSTPDLPKPTPK